MEKFDQRDVYANHVRIYRQIGMIYEPSSDIDVRRNLHENKVM